MDDVVRDALVAVAEAEAALADAEQQLRAAWAERISAFQQAGLTVAFVHEHHAERISQRIVVTDAEGRHVDLDQLAAEVASP
jgi:hypothetical protein